LDHSHDHPDPAEIAKGVIDGEFHTLDCELHCPYLDTGDLAILVTEQVTAFPEQKRLHRARAHGRYERV